MLRSSSRNSPPKDGVTALVRAIIRGDSPEVSRLLAASPFLARESLAAGATRAAAVEFYFPEIAHYLYAGDTPLHAAAAGYRKSMAEILIQNGAPVMAENRRGATPLHYAADGSPSSPHWNPEAQAEMIALLIASGALPNALDGSGVAPLHRAVRQRCVSAVDSLLRHGASVRLKNSSGSAPLHLAVQNTGRGGTGSAESKSLQEQIVALLLKAGADPSDRDGRGKTARQCARSDRLRGLL